MSPLSRRSRRKVKKGSRRSPGPADKGSRRSSWPTASSLEERIDLIMDRVGQAGDDHAERAAALEEYLTLARAHEDETWFDVAAWSEDLADSYLALGRVDDAVRTIGDATRRGYAEGAEMLCELAEMLMRSDTSRRPGRCGSRLAPITPMTSGSMSRRASSTATSATTPRPWNG